MDVKEHPKVKQRKAGVASKNGKEVDPSSNDAVRGSEAMMKDESESDYVESAWNRKNVVEQMDDDVQYLPTFENSNHENTSSKL